MADAEGAFCREERSGGVSICYIWCGWFYWESKSCLSILVQALMPGTAVQLTHPRCWSLGFHFFGPPPSSNFSQKFALQTGSSWCLKFECSGSSCATKPWKLVDPEMYAPRKRAPAAALIPNWRPPSAFVASQAEMQPGPLRNRVITYPESYQGKQAVTIMFGKHSGMKDMLQIRYLINLCFYTESIISGSVFFTS